MASRKFFSGLLNGTSGLGGGILSGLFGGASGVGTVVKSRIQQARWQLDERYPQIKSLPAPIAGPPPPYTPTLTLTSTLVSGGSASLVCDGGTPDGKATIYVCPNESLGSGCSTNVNFTFDDDGAMNATIYAPHAETVYAMVVDPASGEQSNWVEIAFTEAGGTDASLWVADSPGGPWGQSVTLAESDDLYLMWIAWYLSDLLVNNSPALGNCGGNGWPGGCVDCTDQDTCIVQNDLDPGTYVTEDLGPIGAAGTWYLAVYDPNTGNLSQWSEVTVTS